jgi:hypothetical protein
MNPQDLKDTEFEGYVPLLSLLRSPQRYASAAPTYIPKNFIEQFVLYKSGSTYRLYVWYGVSEGWHYSTLT